MFHPNPAEHECVDRSPLCGLRRSHSQVQWRVSSRTRWNSFYLKRTLLELVLSAVPNAEISSPSCCSMWSRLRVLLARQDVQVRCHGGPDGTTLTCHQWKPSSILSNKEMASRSAQFDLDSQDLSLDRSMLAKASEKPWRSFADPCPAMKGFCMRRSTIGLDGAFDGAFQQLQRTNRSTALRATSCMPSVSCAMSRRAHVL